MKAESTFADLAARMASNWRVKARPKQLAPEGDWATWVIRAGRGFGKTRAGAGWVHERAMSHPGRWIALVGRTPADIRDYQIQGPGGLLRNTAEAERPLFEVSKRRLTWPNGSWATLYSDEEPDQLRGYSGDTAWLDEFAKFRNAALTWENLQFGMREVSNDRPRRLITTTPRPIAILRTIERAASTVVVTGSSYENKANLDPTWIAETLAPYEGTRVGRQEIEAEILEDTPGSLWSREWFDRDRKTAAPDLKRVVVGVDPAVSSAEGSDKTGIVVAGIGFDDRFYVLADRTAKLAPVEWAREAVKAYSEFGADRIIAEANNGGDLVEATIRMVDRNVSFKKVHASRGKVARAEPVSALYEQGRVSHVGPLPELEDQMCLFTSDFNRSAAGYSPDNLDACVWAITELAGRSITGGFAIYTYGGRCLYDSAKPRPDAPNTPEWVLRGDRYPPGDSRTQPIAPVLSSNVTR